MAGILISPKVDMQIRNRDAAYKKKFGSPNFRDILRQRCRARIKSKRGALFDVLRPLSSEDEVRSVLSDMLISDVKDISSSCSHTGDGESMETSTAQMTNVQRDDDEADWLEIEKETLAEEEKYIMGVYEQLLEREQAMLESLFEDEMICPLCKKGSFASSGNGVLGCNACSAKLPSMASPAHARQLVDSAVTTHDQFCTEHASFTMFPDNVMTGLFLICHTCSYFMQVI